MRRTLLGEVRDGFVSALRRWPVMLTLTGLITISTAVLSLALAEVLSQVAVLKGAEQLREHRAVFFTPYYPPNGVSRIGRETVQYLMALIDQQQAYTAIVYNMALDDPEFAGGHPTLVLFGDVIPRLFPDLPLCDPAPCAARGAKVVGVVDSVTIGGAEIPVEKTLPRGATLVD